MAGADADKYAFNCEYYDQQAEITKEYLLTYFVPREGPHELSLYDVKNRRVFLKRGSWDAQCSLEDCYEGNIVTINARQFKIIKYADGNTRRLFEQNSYAAHTMIDSDAYNKIGQIMTVALESGFSIKRLKTVAQQGKSQPAVAMELIGPDGGVEVWQQVAHSLIQQLDLPTGCISSGSAGDETESLLASKGTTAVFESCSLCVVRPHAFREGHAGGIVAALMETGLELSSMQTYTLTTAEAEDFCEVYKTVIPEAMHKGMVKELHSGICLAIEVRTQPDAVNTLRNICGPMDVEMAKHLRPNTLRAKFGTNEVKNAVHCTDLPDDGVLESQYFFSILPEKRAEKGK